MKILFALAFIILAGLSVVGMAGALFLTHPIGLVISGTSLAVVGYALHAIRYI